MFDRPRHWALARILAIFCDAGAPFGWRNTWLLGAVRYLGHRSLRDPMASGRVAKKRMIMLIFLVLGLTRLYIDAFLDVSTYRVHS